MQVVRHILTVEADKEFGHVIDGHHRSVIQFGGRCFERLSTIRGWIGGTAATAATTTVAAAAEATLFVRRRMGSNEGSDRRASVYI